jgi:UDP-glucose 4-epimerase
MSVLLTGGLGFIGSNTAVSLVNAGYRVTIVDNCSTSQQAVLEDIYASLDYEKRDCIEFIMLDVCNKEVLKATIGLLRDFDAVIHFAAFKNVGESCEKPLEYYENNLVSLMNILQHVKSRRFIFSSSATVYSHNAPLPYEESQDCSVLATHPYGSTKVICEQVLRDLAKSSDEWSIVSLRYFNPVGAQPNGLLGDPYKPGRANNLFPAILGAYKEGRELSVFGADYSTEDGTAARDYIHVVDLADAHTAALNWLLHGDKRHIGFRAFNVGVGFPTTVMKIIRTFGEQLFDVKYKIVERRVGDAETSYCDNHSISSEIGWRPRYSLEDMVKHTLKYFISRK